MEKVEKKERINYNEYVFRPETVLDISPVLLDGLHKLMNNIISTDGLGTYMLTEPRFEYINKETSLPAKGKVSKKDMPNYMRSFSLENTLNSEPIQYLTEVGKNALALMREIDQIRVNGIDSGKGVLRTQVEGEIAAQQKLAKEALDSLPEGMVEGMTDADEPVDKT